MTWLLVFGGIWVALAALVLLMTAATPTTVQTPNGGLIGSLFVCAVVSAALTLMVAGAVSIIT